MGTDNVLAVINPATGEKIGEHRQLDAAGISERIESAHDAFLDWRTVPVSIRSRVLRRCAAILLERKTQYGDRITSEMGKPIAQAVAEIEKCAWVCGYYADQAEEFLAAENTMVDGREVEVIMCPLGVIYAIMPWNFPFWQAFRALAPALMAGNAMALKGAPNVPGCSADIASVIAEAGAPCGLFVDLPIDIRDSPSVIANPLIRGVTITAGESAGRAVAADAGAHLKKCVLELGGSDPYIVLDDADLQMSAKKCAISRMLCAGQVCIAAKRIIAVDEIYEPFKKHLLGELKSYEMSDPTKLDCQLGPLAREDIRARLHAQVHRSIDLGADLLLGGSMPTGDGWWYPPTVLENVHPGMPAFDEEIFGPVAVLIRADDINHAIALAGNTKFGLGAAIFSTDMDRSQRAIAEIEVGCFAINDYVRSDPRIPFGGTKASGYGRELGRAGIHEFTYLKSVVTSPD